ncbi:MAG TPA: 16S rRNA (guanine(527)-N(7))-methyltransferase RsmG [Bacteroidales bacterium]|nr:16S rRNA (guanine(527)-N(7))-methyltransferase RsmG [Bacteroidales bacterium]
MNYIPQYFPSLSQLQLAQFEQMIDVYKFWNNQINVVSRKDIDNLELHHMLHSLAIGSLIRFQPNTTIIDVGTGGGFPGIPLAVLFPESQFHLIDSIGKKIKVVEEVTKALNLSNVTFEKIRSEDLKRRFEFVLSRAVTELPVFNNQTKHLVDVKNQKNGLPNGIIYLKGGDIKDEISAFGKRVTVTPLSGYFNEEFFSTKKVVHLSF